MGKMRFAVLVVLISICLPVRGAGLETAPLGTLIEEAKVRDGKSYLISGELVGEPLKAYGGGWWLNIVEEGNPCAVFIPLPVSFPVRSLIGGNHRMTGHRLQVSGTLRRICPNHGGDLDFHADRLDILDIPRERIVLAFWWEKWFLLFVAVLSVRLWYHLPIMTPAELSAAESERASGWPGTRE